MPQTRGKASACADAQEQAHVTDKENVAPNIAKKAKQDAPRVEVGNRKRMSSSNEQLDSNKRKSAGSCNPTEAGKQEKAEKQQQKPDDTVPKKPRLTTPDLEFDYDRSQLRDPRPTPGRKVRPWYEGIDVPEDLKVHLEATCEIPKPQKPAGRLNRVQKNDLFVEEARLNPMRTFHHLYRCLDKGREGSPS